MPLPHSTGVPPASSVAMVWASSLMRDWNSASSPSVGQTPAPALVSAACHLVENQSSHLLKSGDVVPLTALASASRRHELYSPAVFRLLLSQTSRGSTAAA